MDKLLPAIDWIKKNRFWLGCGILALSMIGTWFFITMQIAKQTESNTTNLNNKISAADAIVKVSAEEGASAHPNGKTEEGMQQALVKSLDEIIKAWDQRHKDQQSILVWPTEIIGTPKFEQVFAKYDPPERFPADRFKGFGMESFLEVYRVTIPNQMVKICKELGTNWKYDPEAIADEAKESANDDDMGMDDDGGGMGSRGGMGGRGGGMGGGPGGGMIQAGPDLDKYAVIWEEENQNLWFRKLTEFQGFDDHVLAVLDPTPLQVYMLQQDLWLLEAMFKIIKEVNGTADANDLAKIKTIVHVCFGREARTQLGELTPYDILLTEVAIDSSQSTEVDGEAPDMSRDGGEGDGVDEDGFDRTASPLPYHGRYVNKNYEALPAPMVQEVLNGDTLPADNLELIVAKRVPVRIALVMDEREIPNFMTACANSPFAFEINQIRLNRHQTYEPIEYAAQPNNVGGGGAMTRGGMSDDMGRLGMDMGGSLGGNAGEAIVFEESNIETRVNYDVNVEFYGIVKIYNKPRPTFLRKAAGQEVEVDPAETASISSQNKDSSKP